MNKNDMPNVIRNPKFSGLAGFLIILMIDFDIPHKIIIANNAIDIDRKII
jgi:hypothetical protein